MIYGRLNDAQRELLAQGIADSPFDPERWLAERRLRQREIVDTLALRCRPSAPTPRAREAALRLLRRPRGAVAASSPTATTRSGCSTTTAS